MPSEAPSFPRKRESRISNFQTTFEYCRCPKGLDSRLRGNDDLEITRKPKKKPKPNTLDSRFRGNDGGGTMPSEAPDAV
ncbi:hypothetical protein [Neisseria bergeri]|uniref:hypothetical protein n=1 Tax=Neisseria bergeri TaxID=1906581 RepID=UPI0018651E76|nr:hypothetical protein [Neisseria bergeri]